MPTPVTRDLVLEDPISGFVGAVVGWENGLVVLEDRRGKRRSFPFGPNFWLDGSPIDLKPPARVATARDRAQEYARTHTASGSRVGPVAPAKVALPSRIYVEGRHDAELVEKVWGADLRHVGVVVEYLGGIDDLPGIVREFAPGPGRRLGVLVDHLVPGSKESRIVASVTDDHVLVTGMTSSTSGRPSALVDWDWPPGRRSLKAPTTSRASARPWAGRMPRRPTSPPRGSRFFDASSRGATWIPDCSARWSG